MREYVLVLPKKAYLNDILLVLKDKPAWQKNKLNLVGGKMETGEIPEIAAVRELKEETGLDGYDMHICGKMVGKAGNTIDNEDWIVWCLRCNLKGDNFELKPRKEETETVAWYKFWDDERLMPNLKVIIPLLMMDIKGWTMTDQTTELKFPYKLTLELSE